MSYLTWQWKRQHGGMEEDKYNLSSNDHLPILLKVIMLIYINHQTSNHHLALLLSNSECHSSFELLLRLPLVQPALWCGVVWWASFLRRKQQFRCIWKNEKAIRIGHNGILKNEKDDSTFEMGEGRTGIGQAISLWNVPARQ